MTVPAEAKKWDQVIIASATAAVNTGIYATNKTWLSVTRTRAGVDTVLSVDTDYTVGSLGVSGGCVLTIVGQAVSDIITTVLSVPSGQFSTYPTGTTIDEQEVENDLDELELKIQQVQEKYERAFKLPVTATQAQRDAATVDTDSTAGYTFQITADNTADFAAPVSFGGTEKVYSTRGAMTAATGLTAGTRAIVLGESEPFELTSGVSPEGNPAYQGVGINSALTGFYWKRLYSGGEVMASWFGVIYDATATWNAGTSSFDVTGTECGAQLQAAMNYGNVVGENVRVEGTCRSDQVIETKGKAGLVGNGPESTIIAGSGFPATHASIYTDPDTLAETTYTFPAPQYYRQGSSGNAPIPLKGVRFHGAYNALHGYIISGGANHALEDAFAIHHSDANIVFDATQNSSIVNCRGDYALNQNVKFMNGVLNCSFLNLGARHANTGQVLFTRDVRYYGSSAGTDANSEQSGYTQGNNERNRFIGGVWEDGNTFQTGNESKEYTLKIEAGKDNFFKGTELVATPNSSSVKWANGVTEAILVIRNQGGGNPSSAGNHFKSMRFTGTRSNRPAVINDGFETVLEDCNFNNCGMWLADAQIESSTQINIIRPTFSGRAEEEFDASAIASGTNITITAHGFQTAGNEPVKYVEGTGAIGGLTDGTTYYVKYVNLNTVQLAATSGGSAIALTAGTGTASLQSIVPRIQIISNNEQIFDATSGSVVVTASDQIVLTAHGFTTGERAQYDVNGGTVITGLTDLEVYYIKVIDANTIELYPRVDGTRIDLSAVAGSGTTHKLTRYGTTLRGINFIPVSTDASGSSTQHDELAELYKCYWQRFNTTTQQPEWYDAGNMRWMTADDILSGQQTYTAGDATPSVKGNRVFAVTNTSAQDINNFDDGILNQTLVVSFAASGAITAFADAGGGDVTVTSASHGLATADEITISGTTSYNGTFTVTYVDANSFTIVDTWVANDATGTWLAVSGGDPKTTLLNGSEIRLANGSDWTPATGDSIALYKEVVSPFAWVEIHRFSASEPVSSAQVRKTTLTATQVKALNATPIELVPAAGAGKAILVDKIVAFLDYGGTRYTGSNAMQYRYTNGSGSQVTTALSSTRLNSTADTIEKASPLNTVLVIANAPVVASVPVADPGAGNSPITVWVHYSIIDVN